MTEETQELNTMVESLSDSIKRKVREKQKEESAVRQQEAEALAEQEKR